jgi:WD40 repeat protein
MGGRKQKDDSFEGHTDDVTALAISKDRTLIATGQNGVKPIIWVWDSVTAKPLYKKRLPKGSRLVTSIDLLGPGEKGKDLLVATDASDNKVAHLFKVSGKGSEKPFADVKLN